MLFVGHNIPPMWVVFLIYFMNVFPLDNGPVCQTDKHFNQFHQLVAASVFPSTPCISAKCMQVECILTSPQLYIKCKSSTCCLLCCLYFQLFKEMKTAAGGRWRKTETSFGFCDDLEKTNCTRAFVCTVFSQRCSVGGSCSCKEM